MKWASNMYLSMKQLLLHHVVRKVQANQMSSRVYIYPYCSYVETARSEEQCTLNSQHTTEYIFSPRCLMTTAGTQLLVLQPRANKTQTTWKMVALLLAAVAGIHSVRILWGYNMTLVTETMLLKTKKNIE